MGIETEGKHYNALTDSEYEGDNTSIEERKQAQASGQPLELETLATVGAIWNNIRPEDKNMGELVNNTTQFNHRRDMHVDLKSNPRSFFFHSYNALDDSKAEKKHLKTGSISREAAHKVADISASLAFTAVFIMNTTEHQSPTKEFINLGLNLLIHTCHSAAHHLIDCGVNPAEEKQDAIELQGVANPSEEPKIIDEEASPVRVDLSKGQIQGSGISSAAKAETAEPGCLTRVAQKFPNWIAASTSVAAGGLTCAVAAAFFPAKRLLDVTNYALSAGGAVGAAVATYIRSGKSPG